MLWQSFLHRLCVSWVANIEKQAHGFIENKDPIGVSLSHFSEIDLEILVVKKSEVNILSLIVYIKVFT